MGAHGRTAEKISNLNMFLTNGTGIGAPDPARVRDWNNFVRRQQALESRPGVSRTATPR